MDPAQPKKPVFLDRESLARLMSLRDHLEAAEAAFRAHARGRTRLPLPLHVEADAGRFHAKAASVVLERPWFAVKVNSNYPGNPPQGKPTIQGAVLLFDAADGTLLAILDSPEVTAKRTAAASALAALHLARKDSESVAILGCGQQARAQLAAIARVMRVRRVSAWDADPGRAKEYARAMSRDLGIDVAAQSSVADASRSADIIVTVTSAREPFLAGEHVPQGAFIAAVGADNPHKNELHPDLFKAATVVVDSLDQAATMGDLHHAIAAGVATRESVHAELAEIVDGRKPGRVDDGAITIFDSTGLAIQDVAAAAWAYQRATREGD